ncbi:hypothetical protein BDZ97DRAFT_67058 [Flammula alnicola]|nr:hypothetical protein BDZ97DRAFT_67058 [Flammula alnicola]
MISLVLKALHFPTQQPKTTGSRTQARNLNKMFTITNNRIYRQILRIESFGKNGEIVTLCEPFLVAASPRRFRMGSEPSNSSNALVCELDHSGHKNTRRVSETLLALHGVRFSLSEFLTRRDCAGPLYIPAQVYHTQFAEICLDRCDPLLSDMTGDWRILPSYAQWRFHLARGLGWQKVYLLATLKPRSNLLKILSDGWRNCRRHLQIYMSGGKRC